MQLSLQTKSQELTLSALESHLWEAANILQGNPVDRTDWKSYILPLLAFKRICAPGSKETCEDARAKYCEAQGELHRVTQGGEWRP